MLRTILNQVRKPTLTTFPSGFSTKARDPTHLRVMDINDVKIVGTLVSDSFEMESKARSLLIRTNDPGTNKHTNHKVHLKTDANFVAGQRLYILGKLKSLPLLTSNEKLQTSLVIKASQAYLLDRTAESSAPSDQNYVELLANIATDVHVVNDFCAFSVATHFVQHDAEGTAERLATSFHRVMIYDEELRASVQHNLRRGDRVLIDGRLHNTACVDTTGKRAFSGAIIAKKLYRVQRRQRNETNANENDEIKMENF